jgi:hypothetical protein
LQGLLVGGVKRVDPRVQAAIKWPQNNYSAEENAGLGQ